MKNKLLVYISLCTVLNDSIENIIRKWFVFVLSFNFNSTFQCKNNITAILSVPFGLEKTERCEFDFWVKIGESLNSSKSTFWCLGGETKIVGESDSSKLIFVGNGLFGGNFTGGSFGLVRFDNSFSRCFCAFSSRAACLFAWIKVNCSGVNSWLFGAAGRRGFGFTTTGGGSA